MIIFAKLSRNGGAPVDDAVYKMIEASIDDGDALSKSFDAFDVCKGAGSIKK